jgi:uncharacterized protein
LNDESYADEDIRSILLSVKRIAMVGASPNPARPAYIVLKYLASRGYTMLPVNPGHAGGAILGLPVYATLADAPGPIDMVDIFRNSAAAGGVIDAALALSPQPKVIWMQLGVSDPAGAAKARAEGVTVVMNRCPKIEIGRLSGEIGWNGVNTGVLSSRRPAIGAAVQRLDLRPPGGVS